jgi:hypothetical protein
MFAGAGSSMQSSASREQEGIVTESDWLTSTDPFAMLSFLRDRGPVSERKHRLFAVACCRRVWRIILDLRYRRVVEVAELYADGLVNDQERADALAAGRQAGEDWRLGAAERSSMENWLVLRAYRAACVLLEADIAFWSRESLSEAARAEGIELLMKSGREQPSGDEFRQLFRSLLAPYSEPVRDIFGDPFRPVAFSPEWRTEAVVALARGVYEERAFGRLPVLADALEDAGCADDDILTHCRGGGPHVRGCWVVDMVLGRV